MLRINPKKSARDYNIGARTIQFCSDVFSENLAKICNDSITKEKYHKQLKIAKVIALFKKVENTIPKTIDQLVYYQYLLEVLKNCYANNLCPL